MHKHSKSGNAQQRQGFPEVRILTLYRQYHSIHPQYFLPAARQGFIVFHPQSTLALARVSSSRQDLPVACRWPVLWLTLLLSRSIFAQFCTRWLRQPSVRRFGPMFMLPLQSPPRRPPWLTRPQVQPSAISWHALTHLEWEPVRPVCPPWRIENNDNPIDYLE